MLNLYVSTQKRVVVAQTLQVIKTWSAAVVRQHSTVVQLLQNKS